jgi:hypothetical protein
MLHVRLDAVVWFDYVRNELRGVSSRPRVGAVEATTFHGSLYTGNEDMSEDAWVIQLGAECIWPSHVAVDVGTFWQMAIKN